MMFDRREFLRAAVASTWLLPAVVKAAPVARMPTLFFAHGAPWLAVDQARGAQLKELVANLPSRPRGIVAFTPHVRGEVMTIAAQGIAQRSFPRRFLERIGDLGYSPPPADALAAEVRALFAHAHEDVANEPHVAFNHTVWMGLIHMFPAADVPVVEVAIPFVGPRRLFALGQALAPLRESGVLIIASGSLTHNLATIGVDSTPTWAQEFDQWLGEALAKSDLDSVLDWRQRAPGAGIAHPDDGGHFNVLMYALGAAVADNNRVHAQAMHLGFELGAFSTRNYILD